RRISALHHIRSHIRINGQIHAPRCNIAHWPSIAKLRQGQQPGSPRGRHAHSLGGAVVSEATGSRQPARHDPTTSSYRPSPKNRSKQVVSETAGSIVTLPSPGECAQPNASRVFGRPRSEEHTS